jgi:hypothetical protein
MTRRADNAPARPAASSTTTSSTAEPPTHHREPLSSHRGRTVLTQAQDPPPAWLAGNNVASDAAPGPGARCSERSSSHQYAQRTVGQGDMGRTGGQQRCPRTRTWRCCGTLAVFAVKVGAQRTCRKLPKRYDLSSSAPVQRRQRAITKSQGCCALYSKREAPRVHDQCADARSQAVTLDDACASL